MPKLREFNIDKLRYPGLFTIFFALNGFLMCGVVNNVSDRFLLPKLHPTTHPVRVVNNDGTLSDGEKLDERTNQIYFAISGFAWATTSMGIVLIVGRFWPTNPETGGDSSTNDDRADDGDAK
jgi:hypothetical protein